MYISQLTLHNFKGFYTGTSRDKDKGYVLDFQPGINFLVGNNNCGKSTIFRALKFISEHKEEKQVVLSQQCHPEEEVSVELVIKDEKLQEHLESSITKLSSYVDDAQLIVQRSSAAMENPLGKDKFSIKDARFYHPIDKQYQKPSGIDTSWKNFFDFISIDADIDASDIASLTSTKTAGKIIRSQIKDKIDHIESTINDLYEEVSKDLSTVLESLSTEVAKIVSEQFGDVNVKFVFHSPTVDDVLKSGAAYLSEHGIETPITEKGNGLQRAFALALIQILAQASEKETDQISNRIFLLDEPETFLHPQAQEKLLKSLETLAKRHQIFINTHSPYLLTKFNPENHSLHILRKSKDKHAKIEILPEKTMGLMGKNPTIAEINYFAFKIISIEFHNELYGYIEENKLKPNLYNEFTELMKDYCYPPGTRRLRDGTPNPQELIISEPLATYIRHTYHHPYEKNPQVDEADLEQSIKKLIKIIHKSRNNPTK